MRLSKIIHAGIVLETKNVCITMDPVLVSPFESNTVACDPAVVANVAKLKKWNFDLIILSHEHTDHFELESLNQFSRDTPVAFPSSSDIMRHCLKRLGFKDLRPIDAWKTLKIKDVEIHFTDSKGTVQEVGAIFRTPEGVLWNLVDTHVDEKMIRRGLKFAPKIDLLLAGYQPLIEFRIWKDALGGGFPYDLYRRLIQRVMRINPKAVVPFSCNFQTAQSEWMNRRLFPNTEPNFVKDMTAAAPKIKSYLLPPGACIEFKNGKFKVTERYLDFVKPATKWKTPNHIWRPESGVPALKDKNTLQLSTKELKRLVHKYLNSTYLDLIQDPGLAAFTKQFSDYGAHWQLDIVYPDNTVESRWMDLSKKRPMWSRRPTSEFCQLFTSVTATAIAGVCRGDITPFALIFGDMIRRSVRLYKITQDGPVWPENGFEDPLYPVLCAGGFERYLHRQLNQMGF